MSRVSLTSTEGHTSELAALGDRWAAESVRRSSGTRAEIDTLSSAASMSSIIEASPFESAMLVGGRVTACGVCSDRGPLPFVTTIFTVVAVAEGTSYNEEFSKEGIQGRGDCLPL